MVGLFVGCGEGVGWTVLYWPVRVVYRSIPVKRSLNSSAFFLRCRGLVGFGTERLFTNGRPRVQGNERPIFVETTSRYPRSSGKRDRRISCIRKNRFGFTVEWSANFRLGFCRQKQRSFPMSVSVQSNVTEYLWIRRNTRRNGLLRGELRRRNGTKY